MLPEKIIPDNYFPAGYMGAGVVPEPEPEPGEPTILRSVVGTDYYHVFRRSQGV